MPASKPLSKRSPPLHDSLATCQAVSSARPAGKEQEEEVEAVSTNGRQPNGQLLNGRQSNGASVEPAKGTSNGTAMANGAATSGWSGEELTGYEGKAMQQRLRVAVDVDEVLGSFLSTLNLFCAEKYSVRHDLHEFYVYDFMKIWKCSQEEANHRVHDFFKSDHFNDGIPIIPGAFDTLRRLSHFTDLVVVTSRQHVIREPTLEWLDNHFPGVFSSVHFGNHFALEGTPRPKSEMCRELGAEVLIDDNPRYAMECAEHGISVLLFDWLLQYPWSKTEGGGPHHELIERVRDWGEVEVAVRQLAVDRAMPWIKEGRSNVRR
ncbi:hypothetical protein CLOM_g872 [Closterium sp. NIES-68]|nr:hypothetical protein CLOM_g872 [Closterium sp. NIES-68]GJP65922.1 hypothetical protein CLOP_g22820 [Closterium sp. NIES-67]